ncbi:MAG: NAD-binding protein [Actinomycetes bacterium]
MIGRVVVVGAGPSGLACALELVAHGPVTLVERTPVVGGEVGWRDPFMRQLGEKAASRGVDFALGSIALRWEVSRLLVASPGRIDWIPASTLFFAGGLRPGTAKDVGIHGDRPAGIIPATVALHLLEADVPLWTNVVVLGSGKWADHVVDAVGKLGGRVTAVSVDSSGTKTADKSITNAHSFRAVGRSRIEYLDFVADGLPERLACDALILAGDPRPNRNVEGALIEPASGVVFVQPLNVITATDRYDAARQLSSDWLLAQRGNA